MGAEVNGLSEGNAQYLRRLQEEHGRYSQQLEALRGKPYISDDERLEEVRLKKLKLRIKDQMSFLERVSNCAVPVA